MFMLEPVLKAFLRFNHFDKYIFEKKKMFNVYDLIIHISLPVYIWGFWWLIALIQPIEGKKYNLCVSFPAFTYKGKSRKGYFF